MYLKSTHAYLIDGAHQWTITLFCNNEANSIKQVDITPKSKTSRVVPNDAKPAPTAYTMTYTTSKNDPLPPRKFFATILLKTNERKTVSVPANMETDRKRRRTDHPNSRVSGATNASSNRVSEASTNGYRVSRQESQYELATGEVWFEGCDEDQSGDINNYEYTMSTSSPDVEKSAVDEKKGEDNDNGKTRKRKNNKKKKKKTNEELNEKTEKAETDEMVKANCCSCSIM